MMTSPKITTPPGDQIMVDRDGDLVSRNAVLNLIAKMIGQDSNSVFVSEDRKVSIVFDIFSSLGMKPATDEQLNGV